MAKKVYINCANPYCTRKIPLEHRSKNRAGHNEYCSTNCYTLWPPSMRQAASKFGTNDPYLFQDYLRQAETNVGTITLFRILQINSAQLDSWKSKLIDLLRMRPEQDDEQKKDT